MKEIKKGVRISQKELKKDGWLWEANFVEYTYFTKGKKRIQINRSTKKIESVSRI